VQRPRPPVWVAVLRNEAAPLVGARGLPVMTIPYAATERIEELGEVTAAFRAAFVGAGGRLEDATVPFGLHTSVRRWPTPPPITVHFSGVGARAALWPGCSVAGRRW